MNAAFDDKISICMPVKNVAPYIRECLESVLLQNEQNWELLITDDHSTDDSRRIISDFCSVDPRIRLFSNPGHGIIQALRNSFELSQGSFISRMDGDDIMMPEKLKHMKASLIINGKGHLALGQVRYFSENTLGNGYRKYEQWLNHIISGGTIWNEIYKECVVPSPSWMLWRSDFISIGGFHEDRYPEDYDLCFRMYKSNLQAIPCAEVLHRWRDYPSRTSRTHPHYADNSFLELKCTYFMECDYKKEKTLMLWGAGKKAKTIALWLIDHTIEFQWLSNNPKKIGKTIYKQPIKNEQLAYTSANIQCIIAVANSTEQSKIRSLIAHNQESNNSEYYFFC